ncbi:MAG: hypothetical protein P8012_06885 [Desulfobacterales bacterium]
MMEPTKIDKKSNEKLRIDERSLLEVSTLLSRLRETGITTIFVMNKKAQMKMLNWAHGLVNQYNDILKQNPMKLKDISELPFPKMDAKLAIKLLLLASVKKGLKDDTVFDLRNKYVSLGSFQSVDQKHIQKSMKHIRDIQNLGTKSVA